ncbi:hypothetical protein CLBKND_04916 [Methylorubrum aminovorans]
MNEQQVKQAIQELKNDPKGVDPRVIAILEALASQLKDKADLATAVALS